MIGKVRGRVLGTTVAALLATSCHGRTPRGSTTELPRTATSSSAEVVEIDLTRGVPEARTASLFGSTDRRAHVDLVQTLVDLGANGNKSSTTTRAVMVRLGPGRVGLPRSEEIGALLGEVRKTKPVLCHADEYDNATLMLASRGCSKLWVSPAGSVEAIGIAAQLLYANRFFERLNITVNYLQVGKYKGAEEMYTRDGPSPEARASLEQTLAGMREAWRTAVADGRKNQALADLVEEGPFTPTEAIASGLVDAIGYAEDVRSEAKRMAATDRIVVRFGGKDTSSASTGSLTSALRIFTGSSHAGTPHVAIVPAVGTITSNPSSSILGGSEGISERELGRILARLAGDASTKAVILRIDSPGGSALASDNLWKRVMRLRGSKKVIVSVGDMAASGGYYIASAADRILAEPTSIVGSIGVVGGKLAIGPALEDYGIHAETIAAAPEPNKAARAAYMSAFTPWDDATRTRILSSIQSVYDLFLSRVAEGRHTTVDKVAPSAEGQIFAGSEALERGLIDELGGLADAIRVARKLAELPEDAPVDVVGNEQGLFDDLLGGEETSSGSNEESRDGEHPALASLRREAVRAFLPQELQGAGAQMVDSLAPLLAGDHILCSLPFGVSLR